MYWPELSVYEQPVGSVAFQVATDAHCGDVTPLLTQLDCSAALRAAGGSDVALRQFHAMQRALTFWFES